MTLVLVLPSALTSPRRQLAFQLGMVSVYAADAVLHHKMVDTNNYPDP